MHRSPPLPGAGAVATASLATVALLVFAATAAAQLRPLDPAMWQVFDHGHDLVARAGIGVHGGQRASLAGTEGLLREIGNFQASWRSGRIALEIGGTVLRTFDDHASFAPPMSDVTEAGPDRRDSGDYHIATLVRLTPPERPTAAVLRFGTRLPTTDNQVGLERDRTDFFALAGGRYQHAGARLSAEVGVTINGTRDASFEQADLLVYALNLEYRRGWITPIATVVGQTEWFDGWSMRGNEELAELRAGVRAGSQWWVQAMLVRGVTDWSPGAGLLLGAGVTR